MKPKTPRDTQATCPNCGWQSKRTTKGLADYALRQHSCAKRQREQAAFERYLARDAAINRTPKSCNHKIANHQHGTHACYVLDRCRCRPCSAANSAYEHDRNKRHAFGQFDTYTDAAPIRLHVEHLMMLGVGIKTISAASGVSTGTLSKLLYGKPSHGRPPSRRVLHATAAKLLAVTDDQLARGRRIPVPVGAQRRLQALIALGWSMNKIAARSGLDRQRLDAVLTRRHDTTAGTVAKIADLYDDLWDQVPPQSTHREKIAVARSKKRAAIAGWPVPLAWDDDTIDDPTATPNLDGTVRGVDLADVEWLERQGYTVGQIAERMGITRDAIYTARSRRGAVA